MISKGMVKAYLSTQFALVRSFLFSVLSFYIQLVFVAYGKVPWCFYLYSCNRFGLFCLRWKSVWSFIFTVRPLSGNWMRSFLLRVPPPLVALYCAMPRDYLSDTPLLRAMGFFVSQHGLFNLIGCDTPSPFSGHFPLGEHAK